MKKPLELLNNIQVASPCTASWDEMTGDDQVRFCRHCDKNVYNLSALTSEAALDLMRATEGILCGRFFRRADGTILTADCPVGVHHRVRRKRKLAFLAASFAGLLGLSGCSRDESTGSSTANVPAKQERVFALVQKDTKDERCVMGKIDMPIRPLEPQAGEPRETEPEKVVAPREIN